MIFVPFTAQNDYPEIITEGEPNKSAELDWGVRQEPESRLAEDKDYPSDRINQTIATIVPTTMKTTAEMIPMTNSQSFNPARRVPVAA
jgi:hypothetical protein